MQRRYTVPAYPETMFQNVPQDIRLLLGNYLYSCNFSVGWMANPGVDGEVEIQTNDIRYVIPVERVPDRLTSIEKFAQSYREGIATRHRISPSMLLWYDGKNCILTSMDKHGQPCGGEMYVALCYELARAIWEVERVVDS